MIKERAGLEGAVTTIQISVTTRDRLRQLFINGETYDELLLRLMELAKMAPAGRPKE